MTATRVMTAVSLALAFLMAAGCQQMMENAVPKADDAKARQYIEALAAKDWATAALLSGRTDAAGAADALADEAAAVGDGPVTDMMVYRVGSSVRVSDNKRTESAEIGYAFRGAGGQRAVVVTVAKENGQSTVTLEEAPAQDAQIVEGLQSVQKYGTWCCVGGAIAGVVGVALIIILIVWLVRRSRRKAAAAAGQGPLPPNPPGQQF
jgi:hypothetical protein